MSLFCIVIVSIVVLFVHLGYRFDLRPINTCYYFNNKPVLLFYNTYQQNRYLCIRV